MIGDDEVNQEGSGQNEVDGLKKGADTKTVQRLSVAPWGGRLKMREWKMRYGQKCKGGKCRSSLAVWKTEPRLYRDTALSYFMENVLRRLTLQLQFILYYLEGLCFAQ